MKRIALLVIICCLPSARARTVKHTVKRGETLESLAEKYYGDGGQAAILVSANHLSSAKLHSGQRLKIPIPSEKMEATQKRVGEAIDAARDLYKAGEFAAVPPRLVSLLITERPNREQTIVIEELMAFCYVALGEEALARRAFAEILAQKPDFALDPTEFSPKILTALQQAKALSTQP